MCSFLDISYGRLSFPWWLLLSIHFKAIQSVLYESFSMPGFNRENYLKQEDSINNSRVHVVNKIRLLILGLLISLFFVSRNWRFHPKKALLFFGLFVFEVFLVLLKPFNFFFFSTFFFLLCHCHIYSYPRIGL